MGDLAIAYKNQGKYSDAEAIFKQCLDMTMVVLGENHTLTTMSNLAATYNHQGKYSDQGKYRDAEVLYKQCLDKSKVLLGESHPLTLNTMNNLANTFQSQGKHRDAEVLYKQCLDKMKAVFGRESSLYTMNNLSRLQS